MGTPHAVDGHAQGLTENIPDGDIQARDGLERQAAVAQDVVGGRLDRLPARLRVGSRQSQEPWRHLVVDDPDDDRLLIVGVAGIRLRGDPVRGREPGHYGAAPVHPIAPPGEPPRQWRAQGECLDPLDPQRIPREWELLANRMLGGGRHGFTHAPRRGPHRRSAPAWGSPRPRAWGYTE